MVGALALSTLPVHRFLVFASPSSRHLETDDLLASLTAEHLKANPQELGPQFMSDRRQLLFELSLGNHFRSLLRSHEEHFGNTTDAFYRQRDSVSEAYRVFRMKDHAGRRKPLDRLSSLHSSWPIFPPSLRSANLKSLKEAFTHAYDSYMYNAWPAGELKPVSCSPGTFSLIRLEGLTLIDCLDTLLVMGNKTEFARSVERLRRLHTERSIFNVDQNVSLFETNIRVLGGLLSAHQMALAYTNHSVLLSGVWRNGEIRSGFADSKVERNTVTSCSSSQSVKMESEQCETMAASETFNSTTYWEYDGCLLSWAIDLGYRLYPAFNTKSGIPYGTVNLLYGVPPGETTVASLAGGGTLTLEFELLSRLSGDERFGKAAKRATRALFVQRSPDFDLFGKHIDVHSSSWQETLSGIGSNSDSFLEYLMKHYTLFPEDGDFWLMLVAAYSGVWRHSRAGDWYMDGDMNRPSHNKAVFESLMAFFPGLQVLLGEVVPAARSLNAFFLVREWLGFLPERFSFGVWHVDSGGGSHPLRPELLESAYFLHRAGRHLANSTGQMYSGWQWAQDFAWRKLQLTRTDCGYASVKRVAHGTSGHPRDNDVVFHDEMPSFFLSETLKYLYLTFDDDNVLHQDQDRHWVFTTEAHPIHNEPRVKEVSKEAPQRETQIRQLKLLLRTKLKGKETKLQMHNGLSFEMWSEMLPIVSFQEDLTKIGRQKMAMLLKLSSEGRTTGVFSPRGLECHLGGLDQSLIDPPLENLSNVMWSERGSGEGHFLRKACPNFGSPDLMWQQAITGGSADYVQTFLSKGQDEEGDPVDYTMYGATEALAALGCGLYLRQVDHKQYFLSPTSVKSKTVPGGTDQVQDGESSTTRLDTQMGAFELSMFKEGGGFSVLHEDSKESINVLFAGNDVEDAFVLTLGKIPKVFRSEKGPKKDSRFKTLGRRIRSLSSMYRESKASHKNDVDFHRIMVLSDLKGNSFSCEVDVVEKGDTASVRSLLTVPCSPALFGPSLLPFLVETDGLSVEAPLTLPPTSDPFGCGANERWDRAKASRSRPQNSNKLDIGIEMEPLLDVCEGEWTQIFHRGECTFFSKMFNVQKYGTTKAVIIINTDENLFGMTQSDEEAASLDPVEVPVTVMISNADGKMLLESVRTHRRGREKYLVARISVRPVYRDPESIEFPIVKGSPKGLHVYAKGGWGVQANSPDGSSGILSNWNLHLVQHAIANKEKSSD